MSYGNLSYYRQDAGALLRDSNHLFTPLTQLDRWINLARREVAAITGCLRVLVSGQSPFGTGAQPGFAIPGGAIPGMLPGNNAAGSNVSGAPYTTSNSFQVIPGVELYPYAYANQYAVKQAAGIKGIVNVMNVAVSWGSVRPALAWMPWEDLQAYARSYNVGVTSFPLVWSCTDEGENGKVWLFPVPSQGGINGEMEWDTLCVPSDLTSDKDYDAIPDGFKNAVKYYAAYLAFLPARPGHAELMRSLFTDQLGISRAASDTGKTVEWYGSPL